MGRPTEELEVLKKEIALGFKVYHMDFKHQCLQIYPILLTPSEVSKISLASRPFFAGAYTASNKRPEKNSGLATRD